MKKTLITFLLILFATITYASLLPSVFSKKVDNTDTYVPNPMPLVWYKFNAPNGSTNIYDSSGNGYTGQIDHATVSIYITNNVYYNLNQFGDYGIMQTKSTNVLKNSTNWSLSCWYYLNYLTGDHNWLIGPYGQSIVSGFYGYSGSFKPWLDHTQLPASGTIKYTYTNWVFLAMTYSNGVYSTWSNDVRIGYSTSVVKTNLIIGQWMFLLTGANAKYYLDDFRIYDRMLSSNEVLDVYRNKK